MITFEEITRGQDVSEPVRSNIYELLNRINKVRAAYNKPMIVSSGLRTMAHHLEIYKKKGITDVRKIPMKSLHLVGKAVDIADPDGQLKEWVMANVHLLESVGLWCESFVFTPTWVHFQLSAPLSGRRFFVP